MAWECAVCARHLASQHFRPQPTSSPPLCNLCQRKAQAHELSIKGEEDEALAPQPSAKDSSAGTAPTSTAPEAKDCSADTAPTSTAPEAKDCSADTAPTSTAPEAKDCSADTAPTSATPEAKASDSPTPGSPTPDSKVPTLHLGVRLHYDSDESDSEPDNPAFLASNDRPFNGSQGFNLHDFLVHKQPQTRKAKRRRSLAKLPPQQEALKQTSGPLVPLVAEETVWPALVSPLQPSEVATEQLSGAPEPAKLSPGTETEEPARDLVAAQRSALIGGRCPPSLSRHSFLRPKPSATAAPPHNASKKAAHLYHSDRETRERRARGEECLPIPVPYNPEKERAVESYLRNRRTGKYFVAARDLKAPLTEDEKREAKRRNAYDDWRDLKASELQGVMKAKAKASEESEEGRRWKFLSEESAQRLESIHSAASEEERRGGRARLWEAAKAEARLLPLAQQRFSHAQRKMRDACLAAAKLLPKPKDTDPCFPSWSRMIRIHRNSFVSAAKDARSAAKAFLAALLKAGFFAESEQSFPTELKESKDYRELSGTEFSRVLNAVQHTELASARHWAGKDRSQGTSPKGGEGLSVDAEEDSKEDGRSPMEALFEEQISKLLSSRKKPGKRPEPAPFPLWPSFPRDARERPEAPRRSASTYGCPKARRVPKGQLRPLKARQPRAKKSRSTDGSEGKARDGSKLPSEAQLVDVREPDASLRRRRCHLRPQRLLRPAKATASPSGPSQLSKHSTGAKSLDQKSRKESHSRGIKDTLEKKNELEKIWSEAAEFNKAQEKKRVECEASGHTAPCFCARRPIQPKPWPCKPFRRTRQGQCNSPAEASSGVSSLCVMVSDLQGRAVEVSVEKDATMDSLFATIAARLGLPDPDALRLSLNSRPLQPAKLRLSDSGLAGGSLLQANLRLRGGVRPGPTQDNAVERRVPVPEEGREDEHFVRVDPAEVDWSHYDGRNGLGLHLASSTTAFGAELVLISDVDPGSPAHIAGIPSHTPLRLCLLALQDVPTLQHAEETLARAWSEQYPIVVHFSGLGGGDATASQVADSDASVRASQRFRRRVPLPNEACEGEYFVKIFPREFDPKNYSGKAGIGLSLTLITSQHRDELRVKSVAVRSPAYYSGFPLKGAPRLTQINHHPVGTLEETNRKLDAAWLNQEIMTLHFVAAVKAGTKAEEEAAREAVAACAPPEDASLGPFVTLISSNRAKKYPEKKGIGAQLGSSEKEDGVDVVRVKSVLSHSPAQRARLPVNSRITRIDFQPVSSLAFAREALAEVWAAQSTVVVHYAPPPGPTAKLVFRDRKRRERKEDEREERDQASPTERLTSKRKKADYDASNYRESSPLRAQKSAESKESRSRLKRKIQESPEEELKRLEREAKERKQRRQAAPSESSRQLDRLSTRLKGMGVAHSAATLRESIAALEASHVELADFHELYTLVNERPREQGATVAQHFRRLEKLRKLLAAKRLDETREAFQQRLNHMQLLDAAAKQDAQAKPPLPPLPAPVLPPAQDFAPEEEASRRASAPFSEEEEMEVDGEVWAGDMDDGAEEDEDEEQVHASQVETAEKLKAFPIVMATETLYQKRKKLREIKTRHDRQTVALSQEPPERKLAAFKELREHFQSQLFRDYVPCVSCQELKRLGVGGLLEGTQLRIFNRKYLQGLEKALTTLTPKNPSNDKNVEACDRQRDMMTRAIAALEHSLSAAEGAGPLRKLYVCGMCQKALKKLKWPAAAHWNGLRPDPVPQELAGLNDLSEMLVAKQTPFMKLCALPAGRQQQLHGAVINVANDWQKVQQTFSFPRNWKESSIVPYALKRKLKYKTNYIAQYVHVPIVYAAAQWLKKHNPRYHDMVLNPDWEAEFRKQRPDLAAALLVDEEPQRIRPSSQSPPGSQPSSQPLSQGSRASSGAKSHASEGAPPMDLGAMAQDKADEDTVLMCLDGLQDAPLPLNLEAARQLIAVRAAGAPAPSAPPAAAAQPLTDRDQRLLKVRQTGKAKVAVAPAEGNLPIPAFQNKDAERDAYPTLFPYGRGTAKDEREERLSTVKYIRNRVEHSDLRFSCNRTYLFFLVFLYESERVSSSIMTQMSKAVASKMGHRITVAAVRDEARLQNFVVNDAAYRFLQDMRGSPQYFKKTTNKLVAMCRQLGPCSFFVTLSASDKNWDDVMMLLVEMELGQKPRLEDVRQMDNAMRDDLIRKYPLFVVRQFYLRIQKFLSHVLRSKHKPLGILVDWFIRYEMQGRGSVHGHLLIWTEGAPILGRTPEHEIVAFIDKYISARVPSAELEPELHELVTRLEMHSHRASCQTKKCPKKVREAAERLRQTLGYDGQPQTRAADQLIQDAMCRHKFPKQASPVTRLIYAPVREGPSLVPFEHVLAQQERLWARELKDLPPQLRQARLARKREAFHQAAKVSVIYNRGQDDLFCNQHNQAILFAWEGNIDVQFVANTYALICYIASYVGKPEKELGDELASYGASLSDDLSVTQKLHKVANHFINCRKVSAQEAIIKLLGLPYTHFSRAVKFVKTGRMESSWRMLKLRKVLDEMDNEEDEDVFVKGALQHYCARQQRKPSVRDMCLAIFVAYYDKERPNKGTEGEEPMVVEEPEVYEPAVEPVEEALVDEELIADVEREAPDDDGAFDINALPDTVDVSKDPAAEKPQVLCTYGKRSRRAILMWHRPSHEKDPEAYFLTVLQLFLPFDSEDAFVLADSPYESYKAWFDAVKDSIVPVVEEFEFFSDTLADAFEKLAKERRQDANSHVGAVDGLGEDQDGDETVERAYDRDEAELPFMDNVDRSDQPAHSQDQQTPLAGQPPPATTTDELQQSLHFYKTNFNQDQRAAFDKVDQMLDAFLRARKAKVHYRGTQLFISGPGGVGKSFVLNAIRLLAHQKTAVDLSDSTSLVVAHTGTAALNVEGSTAHTALGLTVRAKFGSSASSLSAAKLNRLQNIYRNVSVILIDEISLISVDCLYEISSNLNRIFGVPQTGQVAFGGRLVIAFGDLYQLPPVCGTPIFRKPTPSAQTSLIGGHLWHRFRLMELTIIERQKGDQLYAEILNRIRTADHTFMDIAVLSTRLLSELGIPLDDPSIENVPFLYRSNKDTGIHNDRCQERLRWRLSEGGTKIPPKLQFCAVDSYAEGKKGPFKGKVPDSVNDTAGLPTSLVLYPGTVVMVRKNIELTDFLVNGSKGVVTGWGPIRPRDGLPEYVLVRFLPLKPGWAVGRKQRARLLRKNPAALPEDEEIVPIFVAEGLFPVRGRNVRRLMIPLVVSFAMTIHKSQGGTFQQMGLCLSGKRPRAGQAYVAFSRVVALAGLFLLCFDPTLIKADPSVAGEMNRMRRASALGSQPEPRDVLAAVPDTRVADLQAHKKATAPKTFTAKVLRSFTLDTPREEVLKANAETAEVVALTSLRLIPHRFNSLVADICEHLTGPRGRYTRSDYRMWRLEKMDFVLDFCQGRKAEIWQLIYHLRGLEPLHLDGNRGKVVAEAGFQTLLYPALGGVFQATETASDGDCFFHSVSQSLFGDERFTTLLRGLTLFTLLSLEQYYMALLRFCPTWSYGAENGLGLDDPERAEDDATLSFETTPAQRMEKFDQMCLDVWTRGEWMEPLHGTALSALLLRDVFLYTEGYTFTGHPMANDITDKVLKVKSGFEHVVDNVLTLQTAYRDDLDGLASNYLLSFRQPFAARKLPVTIMNIGNHFSCLQRVHGGGRAGMVAPDTEVFRPLRADAAAAAELAAHLANFPPSFGPDHDFRKPQPLPPIALLPAQPHPSAEPMDTGEEETSRARPSAPPLELTGLARPGPALETASVPSAPAATPDLLLPHLSLHPSASPDLRNRAAKVAETIRRYRKDLRPILPGYVKAQANWPSIGKFKVPRPICTSRPDLNDRIFIHRGDITKLVADAIVNAANEACLGGGGVDGAISRAAGPELLEERRLLGGVRTGEAKATFAYRLPSNYIIHAVGPKGEQPALLASAYASSLALADSLRLSSIAFPCISTGVYGFPHVSAAKSGAGAIRAFLDANAHTTLSTVVLVILDPLDYDAYVKIALPNFFPLK